MEPLEKYLNKLKLRQASEFDQLLVSLENPEHNKLTKVVPDIVINFYKRHVMVIILEFIYPKRLLKLNLVNRYFYD